MAKRYGKNIVDVMLSDAQTLPSSSGAEDSTNMAYVGGPTGGKLRLAIYASSAIAIADAQSFIIELQTYSADTAASAISPFSNVNGGAQAPGGSGTSHDVAHFYPFHMSNTEGAVAFSAGDLIVDFGLPEANMALLGHDYVQLVYNVTANEGSETVDAFVYDAG